MSGAERAVRTLALELTEYVPAFRQGQAAPLRFRNQKPAGFDGVGCHQIQFDVRFPVAQSAREAGSADVLEHPDVIESYLGKSLATAPVQDIGS